jgi:hypothetical protein
MPRNNKRKGFKEFRKGERTHLHPSFSILDKIECRFLYELEHRFFLLEYAPKKGTRMWTKELMTTSIESVVETAQEFIDDPDSFYPCEVQA